MRKSIFSLFAALITAGILPAQEAAQKKERPAIVVAEFKDTSGRGADVLPTVNSTIDTYIFKTGRFSVADRENLNRILAEKSLVLSGVTSAEDTAQLAGILAADLFLVGDLVSVATKGPERQIKKEVTERKPKKRDADNKVIEWYPAKTNFVTNWAFSASVKLKGKLINAVTAEISDIAEGAGSVSKTTAKPLPEDQQAEALRSAAAESAKNLIVKIVSKIPLVGMIVDAGNGTYTISLGKGNGLHGKCNLRVYDIKELIHPESGRKMVKKVDAGFLIVKSIDEDTSEAAFFSGDKNNIKIGQRVEAVAPLFKVSAMAPSIVVPGLGQMLNGQVASGVGYLVTEGLFIAGGVLAITGSLDSLYLAEGDRLDSYVRVGDQRVDKNGLLVDEDTKGVIEEKLETLKIASGWGMVGIAALLHIANMVDAGTPAVRNPVFAQGLRPSFNFMAHPDGSFAASVACRF